MQRRKYLAAFGSIAAGGAAMMGTGAFTSVTAERTVDVEVAGDDAAYLGLEPVSSSPNSAYVSVDGEEVSFDFSDTNSAVDGNGFNPDATSRINDLLLVTNQGTQTVNFWVNISNLGAGSDFVSIEASNNPSATAGSLTGASSELAYDGGNAGSVDEVSLNPGDAIYLHLIVDATGESSNSFSGTVTFVAEQGGSP
jgi:hypothetical protein